MFTLKAIKQHKALLTLFRIIHEKDIALGIKGLCRKSITDNKKIADEIGTDEITLMDIVKEIEKPARDPRDEMPKPVFKE